MIKNSIKKRISISIISLMILTIIYLIPTKKTYEAITTYNSNFNKVYLLNSNSLLIQTSLISEKNETIDKAKEIINSLTINTKTKNYINNNLKQIIPEKTQLLDIQQDKDILKLNFSKELLTVSSGLEEKMIESLVYSLTELNGVNKIMIFVNGEMLLKLPNSNKDLPSTISRDYGINKIYEITTISPINKMTLYYFIKIDNKYDAVPVTIFTNDDTSKIEVIVKSLKSSLAYQTDLVSFLNNNTKLLDYEISENTIKLNFNNSLLDNFYDDSLIEEVKYAISSSLKDSLNITDISYYIDGHAI